MMLSIFPGAADSTATGLWNGRKILGFLCPFLRPLGKESGPGSHRADIGRSGSRGAPCADAPARVATLAAQSTMPARVRTNALEHAAANRSEVLRVAGGSAPSDSLANQIGTSTA